MAHHELFMPVTEEAVRRLRINDTVTLQSTLFGIRDATTARAVGRVADAVVIGTRIIQLLEDQPRERVVPEAAVFLRGIRQALYT